VRSCSRFPDSKNLQSLSRRRLLGLLALLPFKAGAASRVRVGSARFDVVPLGEGHRRYIHIHGNETTARTVLRMHVEQRGGQAVFVQGGTRAIRVERLLIDPNRMFSRTGAEASLHRLNLGADENRIERALARIERDVPALLEAVLPQHDELLISIHNNSQGYNIQEEIPHSDAHHLPVPDEPNNFFLATDPRDYAILAEGPFNAVLQHRAEGPDDGSLSRLCTARGIRYVNLEVLLGQAERQGEMLTWLDDALPARHTAD
jgi:xanthine/CO dehydrogenase XdhC/CoxF family maturation factor